MNPDVATILKEAFRHPYGPTRLALGQKAEQVAGDDEDSLFHVRMELCGSGIFSGQPQVCLIAFSWCLAFFDRDSKRTQRYQKNLHRILWRYKWCIGNLPDFASVSLRQISDLKQDCLRRMEESGYTLRGYYKTASECCITLGDLSQASTEQDLAFSLKRDPMSDCHACEIHAGVRLFAYLDQWENCLKLAEPIIDGTLRCEEIPILTLPLIGKAQFKLGDSAKAAHTFQEGIRLSGSPTYLEATGNLIEGLTLIGKYPAGIRLLESRLIWTEDCIPEMPRFRFFAASAFLLKKTLAEEGEFRLKLSDSLLKKYAVPGGEASKIQAWLEKESRTLAAAFDKRNGNSFWTEFRDKLLSS